MYDLSDAKRNVQFMEFKLLYLLNLPEKMSFTIS